jgi:uncharacterized protein (TIGR00251 family)
MARPIKEPSTNADCSLLPNYKFGGEKIFKRVKNGYLLNIKVIPGASKTEFVKTETGFKARVQGTPVDGKANDALITLLSKEFGIPKKDIEIVKGKTSRNKTILIRELMAKLSVLSVG